MLKTVVRLHSLPSPLAAAALCASGELQEGALDLWALRLGDVDATQLDLSLLDAEERRRAAELGRPIDRLSYVAAHVLLRQLLGGHLGVAPQEVAYFRQQCPCCGGPHGRPELTRPRSRLHFSLSRSGGIVLIGIASAPVGVDVEALPDLETITEVSVLLHAAERTEILSAAPSKRAAAFARVWTRKEAYLKGVGIGVTHDLAADYLGTEERATAPLGWTVISLEAAAGYAAAAAVAGPLSLNHPREELRP